MFYKFYNDEGKVMRKIMEKIVFAMVVLVSAVAFGNYLTPATPDSITVDVWQMEEFVTFAEHPNVDFLMPVSGNTANWFRIWGGSNPGAPTNNLGEFISGPTQDFGNAIWFKENNGQAATAFPNVTARTEGNFLANQGPYLKVQLWFRTDRLGQHQVVAYGGGSSAWSISTFNNDIMVTLWFSDGTNSGNRVIADISDYIGQWIYLEFVFSNKGGGKFEAYIKDVSGDLYETASADLPGKTMGAGSWVIIGGEQNRRPFYGAIDSLKISTPPDYFSGDINKDGYVDLLDLAILAQSWLKCTDIDNPDCF